MEVIHKGERTKLFQELDQNEANEILVRSSPYEVTISLSSLSFILCSFFVSYFRHKRKLFFLFLTKRFLYSSSFCLQVQSLIRKSGVRVEYETKT